MDVHMHKDNISQNTNDFFPLPPFWPFSLFLYTACVQCKNVEMYTGRTQLGQWVFKPTADPGIYLQFM